MVEAGIEAAAAAAATAAVAVAAVGADISGTGTDAVTKDVSLASTFSCMPCLGDDCTDVYDGTDVSEDSTISHSTVEEASAGPIGTADKSSSGVCASVVAQADRDAVEQHTAVHPVFIASGGHASASLSPGESATVGSFSADCCGGKADTDACADTLSGAMPVSLDVGNPVAAGCGEVASADGNADPDS
mmetsp:Transcript_78182/g.136533  ORF Transcript_78182/g.136533 Transcript_78182/m.136533 type:complete len:189 (-) Transcript_78182:124-690(-)